VSTVLLSACITASAASRREGAPEERRVLALELRAEQATEKDQCYLYARLVSEMVEYSTREYAIGNADGGTRMLRHSQDLTRKMQAHLSGNISRLKQSEILLRHAAYRLNDLLHAGSYENGPLVHDTLTLLDKTQTDLMVRVFRK
jgi:hypothetical protein